ncbi:hypothetical protein FRX31_017316 [Thalictrum thalictroides]|uniref:Uncharacterized protein n=1 Tax=Thalictrum thalictroides TaxID=46969 RepID=A0A7J6W6S5_THATH|nr:hypothetical protein FRX31_017316 [Thalictrum thalictroides]
MDVSTSYGLTVSDSLNGFHDLNHSYANQKECCISMNSITEECVIEKLGNALSEILLVQDVQLKLSGCISLSSEDELCYAESCTSPEELNADHSKFLNATTQESPKKHVGSLLSEKSLLNSVSIDTKDVASNISSHPESHVTYKKCGHPFLLSTPKKLVSAMKGTREKLGIPLKKLSVTWAPDVYDPLPTSYCHTVKGHSQHRSRNKKSSKSKHKGKSSQGSTSSSKRYHKHVGKSDHRLKSSSTSERLLFGAYNQSNLDFMDFSVRGHDSYCGSSFLRATLPELHIPVAEAT